MKHLSPSPSLLALVALAPAAAALEISDGADVKLGITMQLQVRAERAWASDTGGDTYNVSADDPDTKPQTVDFYLRRVRFGFKGSYKDNTKFTCNVRADGTDRIGTAAADNGRGVLMNQAVIEQIIKHDNGMESGIRAGLDYAFFNGSSAIFSSATALFPSDRASNAAVFLAPRGVGVGYKLNGKAGNLPYTWGFDIQNNTGKDTATNDGASQKGEGLCYTTRFQMVVMDSDAKGHMKPAESFMGAPGTGVFFSVEAGINRNDNTSATATTNLKAIGAEVAIHADGLSALAEVRSAQLVTNNAVAADTDRQSRAYIIQAGYAVPMNNMIVEPAFRWSRIDIDADNSEATNYTGTDYGTSGFMTELGVNCYISKANNKVSLAWQNWRGEDGTTASSPSANIVRAQWQLTF